MPLLNLLHNKIENYSKEGNIAVDPFGGCGTTIVEAKIRKSLSFSVDINPVAVLIAKVKKTCVHPLQLAEDFIHLEKKILRYDKSVKLHIPSHEKINYWCSKENQQKIFCRG